MVGWWDGGMVGWWDRGMSRGLVCNRWARLKKRAKLPPQPWSTLPQAPYGSEIWTNNNTGGGMGKAGAGRGAEIRELDTLEDKERRISGDGGRI